MGLFVQRPEEPSEWAGLPGEPLRPRSRAEALPDNGPVDVAATSLAGLISIPLEVPHPESPDASTGEEARGPSQRG